MVKQEDKKTQSWWNRNSSSIVALLVAGSATLVLWSQASPSRREYKSMCKAAQELNLTVDEIKEYRSLLYPVSNWDWANPAVKIVAQKIPLPTLNVLMEDSEIRFRRHKDDYENDNVNQDIAEVIVELSAGNFIYNKATGRVVRRQRIDRPDNAIARGLCTVIEDLNLEGYLKVHKEGMNFFTMHSGLAYGLTIDQLLQIPGNPDEGWFAALQSAKVSPDYSFLRLYHHMEPKEIIDEYYWEVALASYGTNLKEVSKLPYKPTKEEFDLLKTESIPVDYAMQGMRENKRAEEIVENYAIEEIGVSAEVRRQYRAILIPYRKRLIDPQIKTLASNGMIPDYIKVIAEEGQDAVKTAFGLIDQGRLNGEIWNNWRPDISVEDTLYGLSNNISKERAMIATLAGRSLKQDFDADILYIQMINEVINERQPLSTPVLEKVSK
jgi:hypothetical protein